MSETKNKGEIALTKIMADLIEKGFQCYIPLTEHGPIDLIISDEFGKNVKRLQIKHSSTGLIENRKTWKIKGIYKTVFYKKDDFDYYGIYLPTVQKCIYLPFEMGGKKITTKVPRNCTPFWWYEDFIKTNFDDSLPNKKTCYDFNVEPASAAKRHLESLAKRPEKDVLEKVLLEKKLVDLAKEYQVDTRTIHKWAKHYGIQIPKKRYSKQKVPYDGLEPSSTELDSNQ